MASAYVYAYLAAFDTGVAGKKVGLLPNTNEYNINLFFMIFFLVTLILNFLVDFQKQGSKQNVRDLKQIAENYIDYESYGLRGQFLFDLFPIIPLELIPL